MKVLENKIKNPELLHNLLVEYSKIDFKKYCNFDTKCTDIAFIEIEVEGAELYAMCLIKKKTNYLNWAANMSFSDQLSIEEFIEIKAVEVLESRVIVNNDAVDISSFRLSAAHDEQLYKHV